jgi:predicted transcriptional regulator
MSEVPMNNTERTPMQPIWASEWSVLELLLGDEQRPTTMQEIAREIGNSVIASDAIASLGRAGLIHRTRDGFIFATRAAVHYHAIAG